MKELAQKFIGKKCIIFTFDGMSGYNGTIREVTDGGLLVADDKGRVEALNLNFISRIQEYPTKKKKTAE